MQKNISSQNGQSNYDMCLSAYGGLNNFVKLLRDNGIKNSSNPIGVYVFDTSLIENKLITGKKYNTNRIIIPTIPLLDNDDIPLLDNDGSPLLDNV